MIAAGALAIALNGSEPVGGVIDGGDALYGATSSGGRDCLGPQASRLQRTGCGVVYRVNYDGSGYAVIHVFGGADGRSPKGALQLGSDGRIYGRTEYGGTQGAGVIFSLNRDGSGFSVLARDAAATLEPHLVVTQSGDVYADIAGPNRSLDIVRLHGSRRSVVASYAADTYVRDLRAIGNVAFALIWNPGLCGSEIVRYDAQGSATTLFTSLQPLNPKTCMNVRDFSFIAPIDAASAYATSNTALFRVTGGRAARVYNFDAAAANRFVERAQVSALTVGTDGSALVSFGRNYSLNCGSILSVSRRGIANLWKILPPPGIPSLDAPCEEDPRFTIARSGRVYFTDDRLLYEISDSGPQSLFAFATPPFAPPQGSHAQLADLLQTTTDPHRFFLTRTDAQSAVVEAVTPDPIPVTFKSETSGRIIQLLPEGRTTAFASYHPRGPLIPAIAYRLSNVPPDMYDTQPAVDAFHSRLYEPLLPVIPERLRRGQVFLGLGGLTESFTAMTDILGHTLGTSAVVLLSDDDGVLRFREVDNGRIFQFSGTYRSPLDLPGLTLTVDDAGVQSLRKQYDGRMVYPRQLAFSCVQTFGDVTGFQNAKEPLRVKEVYRLAGIAPTVSLDASGNDATAFSSIDPLAFAFEVPHSKSPASTDSTGTAIVTDASQCAAIYTLAADSWQIPRMFSLTPRVNPSWPTAFQMAVARADVLPGMTREMVVDAIGYPGVYGTVQALNSLDDWRYPSPTPFGQEVVFANGVVVKYVPSAMPP